MNDLFLHETRVAESDTVDPVSRLNELADVAAPWAIRVAATLRLSDHIANGATDLDALGERTGVAPDRLVRLLRYLVARDILAAPEPGRYALTPMSALLLSGAPGGLRDAMDLRGAVCRLERLVVHLFDAIISDEPVYRTVYGYDAAEDLATDSDLSASFATALMHKSRLLAPGIVASYDWAAIRHVVDLGCSDGVILAEILKAHPAMRATLLERPGSNDAGRRVLTEAGVAHRATVVDGGSVDPLPVGGDAYLLVNVLHELSDPQAVMLLRCCADAAGPHGRVIGAEYLAEADGDQATVTRWDLLLLLGANGRERTLTEFRALAAQAGLRVASVVPASLGIHLIEYVPVQTDGGAVRSDPAHS